MRLGDEFLDRVTVWLERVDSLDRRVKIELRYADDSFTSAFVSTVGIDFKVKTVQRNNKRVKLQIWVRNRCGLIVQCTVLAL